MKKQPANKAAVPIRATAAPHKGAPDPATSFRELPEVQERIAELASDMILNGGHEDDIHDFLKSLMRHRYRRLIPPSNEPKQWRRNNESAADIAAEWEPREFKLLARHWPEESRRTERTRPQTIGDMIRANVRGELRDRFEWFMRTTDGLEDVYLLSQVLMDFNGQHGELGEALACQIDASSTYVKCSSRVAERVRKFAAILEDGEEISA